MKDNIYKMLVDYMNKPEVTPIMASLIGYYHRANNDAERQDALLAAIRAYEEALFAYQKEHVARN